MNRDSFRVGCSDILKCHSSKAMLVCFVVSWVLLTEGVGPASPATMPTHPLNHVINSAGFRDNNDDQLPLDESRMVQWIRIAMSEPGSDQPAP